MTFLNPRIYRGKSLSLQAIFAQIQTEIDDIRKELADGKPSVTTAEKEGYP